MFPACWARHSARWHDSSNFLLLWFLSWERDSFHLKQQKFKHSWAKLMPENNMWCSVEGIILRTKTNYSSVASWQFTENQFKQVFQETAPSFKATYFAWAKGKAPFILLLLLLVFFKRGRESILECALTSTASNQGVILVSAGLTEEGCWGLRPVRGWRWGAAGRLWCLSRSRCIGTPPGCSWLCEPCWQFSQWFAWEQLCCGPWCWGWCRKHRHTVHCCQSPHWLCSWPECHWAAGGL